MPPPIVRFAPSPTGYLHIGGARTALFNWLYAKHHKGKFLLRIEDTDRVRSTPESVQTILDGLTWLGLTWDGEAISQFARVERHAEVARQMVANGTAYYCYASPQELEEMRAEQKAKGLPMRYDGRWRDRLAGDAPPGVKPVIRLKASREGETTVHDEVMGKITVQNSQLDDMVLLRADGAPTYMHAVVVDDHDMDITHVIRGDDHMTNTFRQVQIYKAMGWNIPSFAHLPMILGPDGAKLSKRHGAPAVSDYRERGYLPEAIRNYLLRLCWSHGDDEFISTEQAIEWFDFGGIGKSPARFDFAKLGNVNAHYMKLSDDRRLAELAEPFIAKTLGQPLSLAQMDLLTRAMADLKPRAQTIVEIAEQAVFYFRRPVFAEAKIKEAGDSMSTQAWVVNPPIEATANLQEGSDGISSCKSIPTIKMDDKAKKLLTPEAKQHLAALAELMKSLSEFNAPAIEELFRKYAEEKGLKLGAVAQPLRAVLTGSTVSPPIFGVAGLLGKSEVLARLQHAGR